MKIKAFYNMSLLATFNVAIGSLNIYYSRSQRALIIVDPRGYVKLIQYGSNDQPQKDFFERLKMLISVNKDCILNLTDLGDTWMRVGYDYYAKEHAEKRLECIYSC